MISKGTNNKQQNQTAIPCDAGSVVMGRTADNGEYKILKLDSNGNVITANSSNFVAGGNYSVNGNTIVVPAGSSAVVDTYLGGIDIALNPLAEGIYNISPFVTLQTNTNQVESVNIFLVEVGSPLDNYFAGLLPIADTFAPAPAFFIGLLGLVEFWHGVNLNNLSNITLWKSNSQANLQRSVYLKNDNYKLYLTANSPFNFSSGEIFLNCTNLQKIG